MPTQVLPIQDIASAGIIEDMPSVSLPPNVFSDARNVRFHDGAVQKFPGESDNLLSTPPTDPIQYVAFWPSPAGDRYVVVSHTTSASTATVEVFNDMWAELYQGMMPVSSGFEWQHTVFNGGYQLIINNGVTTPRYVQSDITGLVTLPGWDSYAVERELLTYESDGSGGAFDVTATLAAGTRIKVTNTPRNVSEPIYSETVTVDSTVTGVTPDGTLANIGTIGSVTATGFSFTPNDATGGNTFRIAIVSAPISAVTAGVVRAYGNLLVAGNLRETGGRTLTGTVRTSDVAGPGEIPQNWNPFNLGVNTADEFVLASTGTIQDMAELQGVLYIYTDSSIHSIQQTGSPVVPFQIGIVTDNYGADNIDSVIEVDGKHIVVGSDDVFVFAGHPGSISSIVDGRVRDNFRTNKEYKVVRYNAFDELWFWRPTSEIVYVWNYRSDVWTKRTSSLPVSINGAGRDLLIAQNIVGGPSVRTVNDTTDYLTPSWIERERLALTPEFDTETLASIAMLASGDGTIDIQVRGSNAPGDLDGIDPANTPEHIFDLADEYKQDIRVHGRFLNYRMTHDTTNYFEISGFQFDIGKGGTR